jgi:subtilisin family serine protease
MKYKSFYLAIAALSPLLAAQTASDDALPNKLNKVSAATEKALSAASDDVYFVRFTAPALANTASTTQGTLNAKSAGSRSYVQQIKRQQQTQLQQASKALKRPLQTLTTYQYSVNAAVVKMDADTAKQLAKQPGIEAVEKRQMHYLMTDSGPAYIGAAKVWAGEQGVTATKGENVIVGILDTGINTDHASFADIGADGYDHQNPLGEGNYLGDCQLYAQYCNDKLIGVVSFPTIINQYPLLQDPKYADLAERTQIGYDFNGHGSHVASTVAGNVLHQVTAINPVGDEAEFSFPMVSGVAPHANIVSYQVCLPGQADDAMVGCYTDLAIEALEHAIINGVQVINYSVGGPVEDPWTSTQSLAFLNARAFGLHVATSAGNSGPDASTVRSPGNAPWLTSVAAATHDRAFTDKTISLPSGAILTGKGATSAISGLLVDASTGGDGNCMQPFAAGTFDGKIVLCRRGEIARVEKGRNVKAGGALGMVLINVEGGADTVDPDLHSLPAIHLNIEDGAVLLAELTAAGIQVNISASEMTQDASKGSILGGFSSRGPALPYDSYLTPALSAPGVGIYAAYARYQPYNNTKAEADYGMLDGTSMASPHVAGALALLKALHPDWTPAQAQSALMLTANTAVRQDDNLDGSTEQATPFEMGAGMVQVHEAANTSLLLDITKDDYLAEDPNLGGDPTQLNIPSLVNADCLLSCSWTRTVTATKAGSWQSSAEMIQGAMDISVSPANFSLAAGESQELVITAQFNAQSKTDWQFASLVLTESQQKLKMPVSVKFKAGVGPEQSKLTAQQGSGSTLVSGFVSATSPAELAVQNIGLTKAQKYSFELKAPLTEPTGNDWARITESTHAIPLHITSDTQRIYASVLDTTSQDLDFYIGRDLNLNGRPDADEYFGLICTSAGPDSNELCNLTNLTPGTYWLAVHNFQGSAAGATDQIEVRVAQSDSAEQADNLQATVVPSSATEYSLKLDWQLPESDEEEFWIADTILTNPDGDQAAVLQINLQQHASLVKLSSSKTTELAGKALNYQLKLAANSSGQARTLDLEAQLPAGWTLSGSAVDGNSIELTQAADAAAQTIDLTLTPDNAGQLGEISWSLQYQQNDMSSVIEAPIVKVLAELKLSINGQSNASLTAKAGDTVTVAAVSSRTEAVSYQWTQTSGPTVTLNGDTTGTVSLKAPEVQQDSTLVLQLKAVGAEDESTATATVSIALKAPEKKSSGSVGWFSLMLLLVPVSRRFKR